MKWDWLVDFVTGNYQQKKVYDFMGIGDIIDTAMARIEDVMIRYIIDQITDITDLLINLMLEIPLKYLTSPGFNNLYLMIIKLVFVVITPVVMYFGLQLVMGKVDEKELGESFKRFFFMPFFVLLLPIIIRRLIMIVNKISSTLLSNTQAELLLYPDELGPELLLLTIVYAVYLTKVLLWYALRNAKLIFLVIASPLLYLNWCLPNNFSKMKSWTDDITSLLLTQIAHIIQVLILMVITQTRIGTFEGMLFQVGCLILMTRTESWLATQLGGDALGTPKLSSLNPTKYLNPAKKFMKRVIK